jgi:hypothetical protein
MQEAGHLKPILSLNKGHIKRTFHCRRTPEVGTGAILHPRSVISHLFIASAIPVRLSLSLSRAATQAPTPPARSPPTPTRSRCRAKVYQSIRHTCITLETKKRCHHHHHLHHHHLRRRRNVDSDRERRRQESSGEENPRRWASRVRTDLTLRSVILNLNLAFLRYHRHPPHFHPTLRQTPTDDRSCFNYTRIGIDILPGVFGGVESDGDPTHLAVPLRKARLELGLTRIRVSAAKLIATRSWSGFFHRV